MYDVTSQKSYEALENWLSDVRDKADKNVVLSVAGNKVDLQYDIEIPIEEAKKWCEVQFPLSNLCLERKIDFCWDQCQKWGWH